MKQESSGLRAVVVAIISSFRSKIASFICDKPEGAAFVITFSWADKRACRQFQLPEQVDMVHVPDISHDNQWSDLSGPYSNSSYFI